MGKPAQIGPGGRSEGWAPLAVATRSGIDESVHFGVGVAVDATGRVVATLGDPCTAVFPRSALKPLQALAMVALGLDLPDRLLALVCASHDGRPEHVAGVDAILAAAGLGRADLANTPTLPYGEVPRAAALRMGIGPQRITQNCSGKHAGMLATCVAQGWPTAGYLDPAHPLQVAIGESLAAAGCDVLDVGVDGCGAPTHVLRLDQLARAIGGVAKGPIGAAMRSAPEMVGGPTRDVTRWMRAVPGLIAKEGAEGVMVIGRVDGSAAALKVSDGADRARQSATIAALRALGIDVDGEFATVADMVRVPTLGHGRPVGEVRAVPWQTDT